jgi:hypothetical protein
MFSMTYLAGYAVELDCASGGEVGEMIAYFPLDGKPVFWQKCLQLGVHAVLSVGLADKV